MVVPWGYFSDAKNHKPPIFSSKIRGLRFCNLAVKERFEPSSPQAPTAFDPERKQGLIGPTSAVGDQRFRPIAVPRERQQSAQSV